MFGSIASASVVLRTATRAAPWLLLAALGAAHAQMGEVGMADPDAAPAAMAEEAAELEGAEIAARNALFEELDRSGEGYITRGEALAHPDLAQQFDPLDLDGDDRISRAEFAAFETADIAAPAGVEATQPEQSATPAQRATAQPRQPSAEPAPGGQPGPQSIPRPGEAADDDEAAPNVLILRAEVAAMAYETVDAVETHTTIPLAEPIGWAVFSAVALDDELAPGTGMARHARGEEYFLFMSGIPHTDQIVRYVLAFEDEGLFRDFRQGQLDGETLERARAQGFLEAYQVTLADGLEVESIDLGAFTFDLDGELERALIGVPSVTGEIVDPADPWVWNR